MFVLQAKFAYDEPIVGAWGDDHEAEALSAAEHLNFAELESRLEAAGSETDLEDLQDLVLCEVDASGVTRGVWEMAGPDWLMLHN